MKKNHRLLFLATVFAVAGCANNSPQSYEKPPPKANRVQVLMYDNPRPATQHLDVYAVNQEPKQPYKKIALMTCEGRVDQQVVMTTAIYYRARMVGADGVIDAGAIPTQTGVGITGYGGLLRNAVLNQEDRCLFRDYVIVYTGKPLNPAQFTPPVSSALPLENNSPRQR